MLNDIIFNAMETQASTRRRFTRSVQMDIDSNTKLKSIADKLYEGQISMAFREAIRRMYRAEFEGEDKAK